MATRLVSDHCARDECDRRLPPARQAQLVRPEQSKESGPEPPHWYGLPSWRRASAMAASAPAAGGPAEVDGGGGAVVAVGRLVVVVGRAVVGAAEPPAGAAVVLGAAVDVVA